MHLIRRSTIVLLAGALIACKVTTPSDLTNETFSGTVTPGSVPPAVIHRLTVNQTGEFIVKMTALAPDSGATLLISYGQPSSDGASCLLLGQATSGLNVTALDIQLPKGAYCLQVDENTLFPLQRAETFTIVISHT